MVLEEIVYLQNRFSIQFLMPNQIPEVTPDLHLQGELGAHITSVDSPKDPTNHQGETGKMTNIGQTIDILITETVIETEAIETIEMIEEMIEEMIGGKIILQGKYKNTS